MSCVLVIDNSIDIRWILSAQLRRAGFDVVTAADGLEGLDVLKSRRPDCILLDVLLPRMDGFQFLASVRARGVTTPIVIVSNLEDAETRHRAADLGAHAFVPKTTACGHDFVDDLKSMLAAYPDHAVAA